MKGIGIRGIGLVSPPLQGSTPALSSFDFDPLLASFTPSLAKRATSVFAASPIVQGKRDASGTPDYLDAPLGTKIFNQFYPSIDRNQGTVVFWITPEWNGNDGLSHYILHEEDIYIGKLSDNGLRIRLFSAAQIVFVDASAWVAGTTYCIVCRWDTKNAIDGTNYACVSVNDVHTFGCSSLITLPATPSLPISIGNSYSSTPSNAIIQGLTIYRRVLYDGAYGVNVGNGDELNLIYAAGVGKDPCEITGSWDVCFCLPTNATAGALATGTGNAWSHPHSSNLLTRGFLSDRYYGGTNQWGVKFTSAIAGYINCGSGATLDDLHAGAFTAEGWYRLDEAPGSSYYLVNKRIGSTGWHMRLEHTGTPCIGFSILAGGSGWGSVSLDISNLFGKWIHIALTYDNLGDRRGRLYINGILAATGPAAVGVIDSDVANNLYLTVTAGTMPRCSVGWVRLSNNIRYSANFVPSRTPPAVDGNTVEQWLLNEGTGVTATAQVTVPGNNGTISNGTWEQQWYDAGTPVIPRSVSGGTGYYANVGSGATIDNLADNAFTVEGWFRLTKKSGNQYLCYKGTIGSTGWVLHIDANGLIAGYVYCATTTALSRNNLRVDDGFWHCIKMTFDDAGDRKIRLYIDNVEVGYATQTAGVGAISADAAQNGYISAFDHYILSTSAHGWIRWSNVVRGAGMIPRTNPPAIDGNTMAQWNVNEGAGATLNDSSGNANHGTASGTYTWNITPAMEVDSPGARIYGWGYVFGTDAASEGIYQYYAGLTPGANYTLRALAYSEDGVSTPYVLIYDATNGANLTYLLGSASATEKTPSNIMLSFELPTVARHGVAADCTQISVRLLGSAATGVVGWQQVELLPNLIDNPSLNGAVADPFVPYGWTNNGIDAGESTRDVADTHSVGTSVQMNVSEALEYLTQDIVSIVGKFYTWGLWAKRTADSPILGDVSGARVSKQSTLATTLQLLPSSTSWGHYSAVGRANHITPQPYIRSNGGISRFDDLYIIALDDVSLTCTPASLANSQESGGIRVDGLDDCIQVIPANTLFPTVGIIRIRVILRHNATDTNDFGSVNPRVFTAWRDANNYVRISIDNANISSSIVANGVLTTGSWAHGGTLTSGGSYLFTLRYHADTLMVYLDGVLIIAASGVIAFSNVPNSLFVASAGASVANLYLDAVALAP